MRHLKVLAAALFMLSLTLQSPVTKAGTVTEAKEMLLMLRSQIESIDIIGWETDKERAYLLRKLDDALIFVDQARFCKSLKSLSEFSKKLEKITGEGRINVNGKGVTVHDKPTKETDVGKLINDIRALINDLLVQSDVTCN